MPATIYTLDRLPEAARTFWRETVVAQDPATALTASPEWLSLMTAGDPAAACAAVLTDASGDVAAVLPLWRRPRRLILLGAGRFSLRRALVTWVAVGGDLSASESLTETALAGGLHEVFAADPAIDAMVFESLGEPRRAALLAGAATASRVAFTVTLDDALPHYRLRLPATEAEALALRSPKSLGRLRSKEHALARELGGDCRLVEVRGPDDWAPLAERIEGLMNQSWQARLLGHRFLLDRFRGTAERGWLRGFLLLARDVPLAFTLYYAGMGTMASAALGYDMRYARFSPGAILFLHTLSRLYADAEGPPRYLDFGEGDADYKRQWANEERRVTGLMLVRRSAHLRVCFALHNGNRACIRGGRRLLRALHLERALVRRAKQGG